MSESTPFTKILVIGNSTAGKSAFLKRLCFGTFEEKTSPTIGCDFCLKTVGDPSKKTLNLQLWEIAGHDRYAAASKLYLRGASGCLVLVDITESTGLESALKWKHIIMDDGNDPFDNTDIPMILLQNKLDLIDENDPKDFQTKEALDTFVEANHFKAGFQVSAKTNININEAIDRLVKEILEARKIRKQANLRNNDDSLIKLTRHSIETTMRRSLMHRNNQDKCGC